MAEGWGIRAFVYSCPNSWMANCLNGDLQDMNMSGNLFYLVGYL